MIEILTYRCLIVGVLSTLLSIHASVGQLPPVIAITSVEEGDVFDSGVSEILIEVIASDDQGVKVLTVYVDGQDVGVEQENGKTFVLQNPEDGSHSIVVNCTDVAGTRAMASRKFFVGDEKSEGRFIKIYPSQDVYFTRNVKHNASILYVREQFIKTYLQFDLSSIADRQVSRLELHATIGEDEGIGVLGLSELTHSDWTEETIVYDSIPDIKPTQFKVDGYFSPDKKIVWELDHEGVNTKTSISYELSLIEGNDLALHASESVEQTKRPYLKVFFQD